jgi:hypothetical protein
MRRSFARSPAVGLVLPLSLTLLCATPGFAQFSGSSGGGATGSVNNLGPSAQRVLRGDNNPAKPQVAPPPVLPGVKTSPEAAAPTASPADMSPTEALFDAINRGDLTAARDAVNRGADLHGENVIGLSPLELSVDLGRNDISFMLLSMRAEDADSRATARRGSDQRGVVEADAGSRGGRAPRAVARSRATAVSDEVPDEPVGAPRVYSGNGGSPIPAAGFLGFGR